MAAGAAMPDAMELIFQTALAVARAGAVSLLSLPVYGMVWVLWYLWRWIQSHCRMYLTKGKSVWLGGRADGQFLKCSCGIFQGSITSLLPGCGGSIFTYPSPTVALSNGQAPSAPLCWCSNCSPASVHCSCIWWSPSGWTVGVLGFGG